MQVPNLFTHIGIFLILNIIQKQRIMYSKTSLEMGNKSVKYSLSYQHNKIYSMLRKDNMFFKVRKGRIRQQRRESAYQIAFNIECKMK